MFRGPYEYYEKNTAATQSGKFRAPWGLNSAFLAKKALVAPPSGTVSLFFMLTGAKMPKETVLSFEIPLTGKEVQDGDWNVGLHVINLSALARVDQVHVCRVDGLGGSSCVGSTTGLNISSGSYHDITVGITGFVADDGDTAHLMVGCKSLNPDPLDIETVQIKLDDTIATTVYDAGGGYCTVGNRYVAERRRVLVA